MFNYACVSSVARQPLGTCLRRIGGATSAAIDSRVWVNTVVMSSTLQVLVPCSGEISVVAIAFMRSDRRSGPAINRGRSMARRFLPARFCRFGSTRPKRQHFLKTISWSGSAFSLGGVRSVVFRTSRLSSCRVRMYLSLYRAFPRFGL